MGSQMLGVWADPMIHPSRQALRKASAVPILDETIADLSAKSNAPLYHVMEYASGPLAGCRLGAAFG